MTVTPIVIGAPGTVTEGLIQGLKDLEIRGWVETIQTSGWNDKIVVLNKMTLQLYLKTFFEKINSDNLIM